MSTFTGYLPTNEITGRFSVEPLIATPGFPFINVAPDYEAFAPGVRSGGSVVITPRQTADVAGRPFLNGYDVAVKFSTLQTDMADLHNIHLLSTTTPQCQITGQDGKYFNFVNNSASLSAANGSTLLGLTYKITITPTERMCEINMNGYLFKEEMEWLLDNAGSAHAGGSSGTALGLTQSAYDRTKYRQGNATTITHGGVSLGKMKDFTLTLETSGTADHKGRTTSRMLDVSLEVTMQQTAINDLIGAHDQSLVDADIIVNTASGDIFKFTGGAISHVYTFNWDENERTGKLLYTGKIPYNIDEASPNAIDIGVTDASTFECSLIGY